MVSDYFSASFPTAGLAFMDAAIDATPNLSIITQIELLCWKTDTLTEKQVNDFVNDSAILTISPEVIQQCVNLRKGKKIKLPDAIIAVTALAYDMILISRNTSDFNNIPGLRLLDPHKM